MCVCCQPSTWLSKWKNCTMMDQTFVMKLMAATLALVVWWGSGSVLELALQATKRLLVHTLHAAQGGPCYCPWLTFHHGIPIWSKFQCFYLAIQRPVARWVDAFCEGCWVEICTGGERCIVCVLKLVYL